MSQPRVYLTKDNVDEISRITGKSKSQLVKALIQFSHEGKRSVAIPVINFGPSGLRSYTKDVKIFKEIWNSADHYEKKKEVSDGNQPISPPAEGGG